MSKSTDGGSLAGAIIAVLIVVFLLFLCHYFREKKLVKKEGAKAIFIVDTKGPNSHSSKVHFQSVVTNPLNEDIEHGHINENNTNKNINGNMTQAVLSIPFLKNATKYGYLSKKSTGGRMLKRWFFIKKGHLFYTHTFEEIQNNHNIEAFKVSNLQISTIKVVDPLTFRIISPGARELGQGGEYELHGDNPIDVKEWVDAILKVIKGELDHALTPTEVEPTTPSELFVPGQRVLKILKRNNPVCADCGAPNPEWASLNLCVMMCIECSGPHRSLGAHISKVRSTTLDKWTKNNCRLLIAIGNNRANAIWEARREEVKEEMRLLGKILENQDNKLASLGKPTPTSDRAHRERYIVDKYSKKLFLPSNLVEEVSNYSILEAAQTGDVLGVNKAIIAGIDINTISENDSRTPLHLAVIGQHQLCVELLCQSNAFTDIPDSLGLTPLDIAKEQNNQDLITILERNVFRQK